MHQGKQRPAGIVRPHLLALSFALFGLTACSLVSADQMSFVGPTIEGVRYIVVSDPDGENRQEILTAVPDLESLLTWAPDGVHAVVSGADREIYVADTREGRAGACLSCGVEGPIGGVAFSPDGSVIAFGADDGLYLIDADGSNRRQIASVPNAGWVTWSPDGDTLVFEGGINPWDLYRVDTEGTNLVQITESPPDKPVVYFKPQFSPNGDLFAVHMLRDGTRLMLMNSDGTDARKLTDWEIETEILDPAQIPPPAWSPDGRSVAFLSSGVQGRPDVYAIDADGSGLRNLTNSPSNDNYPSWSPDGRLIAFVTNRDGNDEIYVINADGSDPRNISQSPTLDVCCPLWKP